MKSHLCSSVGNTHLGILIGLLNYVSFIRRKYFVWLTNGEQNSLANANKNRNMKQYICQKNNKKKKCGFREHAHAY